MGSPTRPALPLDVREAAGVQVGAANTQHNYFCHRMPAASGRKWVGVAPRPAEFLQERAVDAELDAALAAGGTAVLTQVLSGLGGVGKTQVAAKFARQMWTARRVDLVVWISASDRAAITAEYAHAWNSVHPDAPAADDARAAGRFLVWLENADTSWLVVLDDVVDPGDLRGLWPPAGGNGHVIVTTRRRDGVLAGHNRQLLNVGLFTPAEAATYLQEKLQLSIGCMTESARMAADLGHLPLALAQAAAYILDRGLTCSAYRRRFSTLR